MAISRVGQGTGNSVTTLNISVTGTAGVLGIAVLAIRNGTSQTPPVSVTGWTHRESQASSTACGAVYTRTLTGDANDNFNPSWSGTRRCNAVVIQDTELTEADFEDSAEDITNVSGNVTSQNTGSATAVAANGRAFPIAIINDIEVEGDISFTTGTLEDYSTESLGATIVIGSWDYTSAGAKEDTITWDTAGEAYGMILVFERPVTSSWDLDGATSEADEYGVNGILGDASTITMTATSHEIKGITTTEGSDTQVARVYLKTVSSGMTFELSVDGGSTYTDVSSEFNGDSFAFATVQQTVANPQFSLRVSGSINDTFIWGNGELFIGETEASLGDCDYVITGETQAARFAEDGATQTGSWSAAVWTNIPDNTVRMPMNDVSATLNAVDGNSEEATEMDGTIQNYDAGGW